MLEKSYNVLLLFILMIVPLFGCSYQDPVVRVGANVWLGYEPLYLAADFGFFTPEQVHLAQMLSTVDVMQAMRGDMLDVAALTLDEFITLRVDIPELQVFAVLDYSSGADAILAQPGASLTDAKRLRVGVEGSAVGGLMLASFLESRNMVAADVDIIQLPYDLHLDAFKEKKVDLLVTFEPIRSQLLVAGARELYSSADAPGLIVDVLVARKKYIQTHGKNLQNLLRGSFKVMALLSKDPLTGYQWVGPRQRLSAQQVERAQQGITLVLQDSNNELLRGESPILVSWMTSLASIMTTYKLLFSPFNSTAATTDEVIRKL